MMGVIKLSKRRIVMRRRLGGRTMLIRAATPLLCLVWLAGCGSSPGGPDNNAGGFVNDAGSANAQPSGCFLSSSVHPAHKSRSIKQVTVTSALFPMPIVPPEPHPIEDFSRPSETDLGQQHDW